MKVEEKYPEVTNDESNGFFKLKKRKQDLTKRATEKRAIVPVLKEEPKEGKIQTKTRTQLQITWLHQPSR